jgi:hypothetical protein
MAGAGHSGVIWERGLTTPSFKTMPYKPHERGNALHPTHASGGRGGEHKEPHPSGKGKIHVHRARSGGGKITEYMGTKKRAPI